MSLLSATPLLLVAAFVAGIMNSVAGGGSFLTFPVLVFAGIPSVAANATSTAALFPGSLAGAWSYRHDFPHLEGPSASTIITISLVGGMVGALLLILTPEHTFNAMIPWLLLATTLLFWTSKNLTQILKRHFHIGPTNLLVTQFLIAVYGGYFGGAIGIMMLALFSLFGVSNIHSANALKTLLSGALNAIAVACFVIAGKVIWAPAMAMLVAAIAGGFFGAHMAKRMNPDHVRLMIVAIGFIMTGVFFLRQYLQQA